MNTEPHAVPTFRQWLRRQLDRRGWSGAELGRRMDVPTGTVNNWLRGSRKLTDPELIRRMAEALHVHQDEILEQLDIRDPGADRIVSTLANEIGYPVPTATIVEVPDALVPYLPKHDYQFIQWQGGAGHGVKWVGPCRDSNLPLYATGDNIQRYADLAILFGAAIPCDQQFLYEDTAEALVWSVDHGLFLEIEERWSESKLAGFFTRELAPDPWITVDVLLPTEFIQQTCRKFSRLSDEKLAALVGSVPPDWGISIDEKVLICAYLSHNRDVFTSRFASDSGVA